MAKKYPPVPKDIQPEPEDPRPSKKERAEKEAKKRPKPEAAHTAPTKLHKGRVEPEVVRIVGEAKPAAKKQKTTPLPTDKLPEWTGLLVLAIVFGSLVIAAVVIGLGINSVRQAAVAFEDDIYADIPTATPDATPDTAFLAPTVPAWQGTERVTVLLLGADARPGETTERPLTDSIMLLMLDPTENVASVLSIPRDLYMEVPGYGLQRVNTAFPLGGGPLALETVQYNFGIRIDYYVLINFEAFVQLVDEIGGITVEVEETINDTTYPAYCETRTNCGYDPFYIEAGTQTLDGATALKYARTRHGDNDYERSRRQQKVLFAIQEKVTNPETFPTLIREAPDLYQTFDDSIQTNMSLDQMIALANSAQQVQQEDIRTGVIDSSYVQRYFTPQGADVLIPNRSRLSELLYEVFWQECLEGGCPHAGQ